MADTKKTIKGAAAGVLSVTLVIGAIAGGMVAYKRFSQKPVNVYRVSDLASNYYWEDSGESYGTSEASGVQKVTISDSMTVTDVFVTEGQEVKAGDKLMAYDTTLTEIKLKKAEIQVQQAELAVQKAEKELQKIGYTASVNEDGNVVLSFSAGNDIRYLTEADQENADSDSISGKTEETDPEPSAEKEPEAEETDSSGTGSDETGTGSDSEPEKSSQSEDQKDTEPESQDTEETKGDISHFTVISQKGDSTWHFLFPQSYSFELSQANLKALFNRCGGTNKVMIVFEVHEKDSASGSILHSWGLILDKTENGIAASFYVPADEEESTETESTETESTETESTETESTEIEPTESTETESTEIEPTESTETETEEPESFDYGDDGSGLTWAEIQKLKKEKQDEIRDLKLILELAKLDLKEKQTEYSDGIVYSKVSGTVKVVRDADEAYLNSEPVIEISAGGGYYITGAVSELQRDSLTVGDQVQVESWNTGDYYEGTISEVSDQPTKEGLMVANSTLTYYSFTVMVGEDEGLTEDELCGVSLPQTVESGTALYLTPMMVRTEAGHSYVYVMNGEGKLEKRILTIGSGASDEVKITDGLTMDDYIAFPYGDAEEGAKAQIADVSQLENQ